MSSTTTCTGQEIDQSRFDLPGESKVDFIQHPDQPALELECLCPFCGTFNSQVGKPCSKCNTEDTLDTRVANQQRCGPWFVLHANNPDAPGMNFAELIQLVHPKGTEVALTGKSVVRGPTTGQLWRLASRVRGLSREFGVCYSCAGDIEADETICPHCDRPQSVPEHVNAIPQTPIIVVPSMPQQAQVTPSSPSPHQPISPAVEPIIHVHSLSHPQPLDSTPVARPVVAECSERHFPKDDLLTPCEVAKAFHLQFGVKSDGTGDAQYRPYVFNRRIKIALTSAAALLLAVLVLWPVTKLLGQWINDSGINGSGSNQPVSHHSTAGEFPVAPAAMNPNPSKVVAYAPPERIGFLPNIYAPAPPIQASAVLTPKSVTPQVEPVPAASSEDDPKQLWTFALDAESTGNFAAAVSAYEKLESLPSNLWPKGLETRLALARKELKGDLR